MKMDLFDHNTWFPPEDRELKRIQNPCGEILLDVKSKNDKTRDFCDKLYYRAKKLNHL